MGVPSLLLPEQARRAFNHGTRQWPVNAVPHPSSTSGKGENKTHPFAAKTRTPAALHRAG